MCSKEVSNDLLMDEDENEKSLEWGFWIYKFNSLFVSLAMTSSSFVGIT